MILASLRVVASEVDVRERNISNNNFQLLLGKRRRRRRWWRRDGSFQFFQFFQFCSERSSEEQERGRGRGELSPVASIVS